MSLSPLFAAKRRRSMDPKLLKSASECEEDQYNEVDRKTSSPLDPSSLTLPNRRFGETRNSCFDLDMKTIRALQEKADKAMGKGSKKEESDGNDENSTHSKKEESDGNDENSTDSKKEESDRDDENSASDDDLDNNTDVSNTRSEETENERRASECAGNVMDRESCSYQRPRANTVCGATSREWKTSPTENTICGATTSRVRKISQISINVGNASKNDFKPVSFTFNKEDIQRNGRRVSDSATIQNAQFKTDDLKQGSARDPGKNSTDASLSTKPFDQAPDGDFKPQKLTLQSDKCTLDDGTTTPSDNDELPTICVNDELYLSSPPPIALTLNNNIEKMDRQELMTKPPSIQSTTSNKNITNVNIIPDGVQAITVQLGNLNGLQFNSKQISCSVRRSSTGSAPC